MSVCSFLLWPICTGPPTCAFTLISYIISLFMWKFNNQANIAYIPNSWALAGFTRLNLVVLVLSPPGLLTWRTIGLLRLSVRTAGPWALISIVTSSITAATSTTASGGALGLLAVVVLGLRLATSTLWLRRELRSWGATVSWSARPIVCSCASDAGMGTALFIATFTSLGTLGFISFCLRMLLVSSLSWSIFAPGVTLLPRVC